MSQPPAPTVDRPSPVKTGAVSPTQPVPSLANGPGYYTVKRGDTLYRIALENGQDYRDIANWNGIANPSSIKEGQLLRVLPQASESGAVVAKPVSTAPLVESRSLDAAPAVAAGASILKREPRGGKEPYSDEANNRLNRLPGESPKTIAESGKAEVRTEPKVEPAVVVAGPDEVSWAWPSSGKVVASFGEANKGFDFAGKAGDAVLAAGDGKVVYAGSGLRGYGELVIVKHNATYLSAYAHNRKLLVKEGQAVTRGQKIAEMGSTDSDSVKLHFEIRKLGKPSDPGLFLPKR